MNDPAKKKKDDAINELSLHAGELADQAYALVVDLMEKHFDTKGGYVLADKGFVKELNRITDELLQSLQNDPQFTGPITKFAKRMDGIAGEIEKFHKRVNGVNVPQFETSKKVAIEEILDQMLNNGLNQGFVQPLRDLIYQNVTSGLSLKEAKVQIKKFIQGGKDTTGKLKSYIDQTAQQSVDSYAGMINMKITETLGYDTMLMTGTLIDNSAPQCVFALKDLDGKITRQNWPQVASKATKKSQLIPGTTFDNLPLNLLHWGCRHSFYPVKA